MRHYFFLKHPSFVLLSFWNLQVNGTKVEETRCQTNERVAGLCEITFVISQFTMFFDFCFSLGSVSVLDPNHLSWLSFLECRKEGGRSVSIQ